MATIEQLFGNHNSLLGSIANFLFGGQPSGGVQVMPAAPKPFYPSTSSADSNYTQQVGKNYSTGRYTVSPVVETVNKSIPQNNYDYSGTQSTGGGTTDTGTGGIIQPNYPAGSFDVTPFQTFYNKAYEQLAPYYAQLLKEAGGDLNLALTNLENDYKQGKRVTMEDFSTSMQNLGLTLPKEQMALSGNLNQRGIALTENPQGQTQYAGGGEAAREVGMLNEDQKLRAEAVKRTQQRGLQTLAMNKVQGGEAAQQSYRDTTEKQQAAHETAATNLAGQLQNADIAQKQAGINKANYEADTGVSSPSSSINPNDVNSIKAAHPGYQGWNDTAAILADYKATGGAGK